VLKASFNWHDLHEGDIVAFIGCPAITAAGWPITTWSSAS